MRRDGSQRITLAVSGEAWLSRLLLRLGPRRRGFWLRPPKLIDAGVRAATAVLQRYGVMDPGS
jgi:hypothetical protein